jgi:hypothetical protein
MSIPADTKDWTWVIERPCPQCGLDAASVELRDLPKLLRRNALAWVEVLRRPDVARRPSALTWSPLEYGCHVRDVHDVFGARFALMLATDDPQFDNWDQDRAAVDGRYGDQDPAAVAVALQTGAEAVAGRLANVVGDAWERPGRRSNGSTFSVASLARYYLHDVTHHGWDVGA